MNGDVIPWHAAHPGAVFPRGRDVVDGWAAMLTDVAELSRVIAGTEFVPAALRGKPAAVGAAILAGRELGIGPMTALQHLHVIEGRPSMSAQLMRALVLAHGHRIHLREATTNRAVMVGTRAGEEGEPTTVVYSMDDARRAGLDGKKNWRTMPRQMLIARATGELCRVAFADVIGGMAYTSEEAADFEPGSEPAPASPSRTVKRRTPAARPPAGGQQDAVRAAPSLSTPPPAPPTPPEKEPENMPADIPAAFPGEDPFPVLTATPDAENAEAPAPPALPAAEPAEPVEPRGASGAQQRMIMALLRELDAAETRDTRIRVTQGILGRRLETFKDVTAGDATALIDTLTRIKDGPDPAAELEWAVDTGLAHIADNEPEPAQDDHEEGGTP